MQPFFVSVESVAEGVKLMRVLADYDRFQFDHNIKPDYSNVGGIQVFDPEDATDGPDGSWTDWCDPETGEDDPARWLEEQTKGGGS